MEWLLVLMSMSLADPGSAEQRFFAGFTSEQACEDAGAASQSIHEISIEAAVFKFECHPFLGQN